MSESDRKRILFVDDESNVLDGLRRMLFPMRHDWEMAFVISAKDALAALAQGSFDIVVTDMRMPGVDGAQLLDQVAEMYPETVRLVLSGQWDQTMSIRSAKSAHQYLVKPCNADTLKMTLERIFALRRLLHGPSLKRLVAGLTSLPSLPIVYQRLMEGLESPNTSAGQIGDIVATDIAMSAKVLQLANSAFFGIAKRLSRPADAARYLGVDTIKALVLTLGVFSQFDGVSATSLPLEKLQQHSLETAHIAQAIARHENAGRMMVDDSFLAGLMHDVGKLVLLRKDAEMFDRAMGIAESEALDPDQVEAEVFGASHAEVGSYLLWLWGMPTPVTEAVAFHHQPSQCPATSLSPLVFVHAANVFAHEAMSGDGFHPQLNDALLAGSGVLERIPEWRQIARETIEKGTA